LFHRHHDCGCCCEASCGCEEPACGCEPTCNCGM
jgi:hypothetical protein